jgi:PEP-CTERM motif
LNGTDGKPLAIDGLWALTPGNDGGAGSSQNIYFTAGPMGESHGLFGVIQSVPEPSTAVMSVIALGLVAAGCRCRNRQSRAIA